MNYENRLHDITSTMAGPSLVTSNISDKITILVISVNDGRFTINSYYSVLMNSY